MNINLNRRERILVTGTAVFIGFFIVFNIIIAPVFEKRDNLASELASKRTTAQEMQKLRQEYLFLTNRIENARKQYAERSEDFSLFAFMERLADTSGVKNNITYMRPGSSVDDFSGFSISQVEMRLQDITLEQLAKYLFYIETSDYMVQVRRLSITKSGEREGPINAVMRVEAAQAS